MDAAVPFPATPKAVKAAPLKLNRRMSAEQAFERIVGNCLAQIVANEEGVARFHDVESLHQMRVGLAPACARRSPCSRTCWCCR
ncbi:CHAD domain-containing protein [Massilia sp. B-10]|nr:CHAD domain-containing protein [Massilia sp. B-10]